MNDRLTSEVHFTKMTGAGNDFILVDNMDEKYTIDWPIFTHAACDRRYGIGADGLLVLEPSARADFTMRYYNSDGSYGGMCGNGGRCSASFLMEKNKTTAIRFEALDHIYSATSTGISIRLHMKPPQRLQTGCKIETSQGILSYNTIDTGSPHAVFFLDELPKPLQEKIEREGIEPIGREVRSHTIFSPEGTNVDFLCIGKDQSVTMRTYERGVEGETLACGTGAVASAIISSFLRRIASPAQIRTRSNEILTVHFTNHRGKILEVILEGPAKKIFEGEFTYIASA